MNRAYYKSKIMQLAQSWDRVPDHPGKKILIKHQPTADF